jgi:hypothetical protein
MSLPLSSIVLGGFTNGNSYYYVNDLTWSLQYSICGQSGAQAGICTALYTDILADASGLQGGPGKAMGCSPSIDYTGIIKNGINGTIITIAIDSLGAYALTDALIPGTADLYTNGDSASGLNVDVLSRGTYITIRNKDYFIIDSVPVDYNMVTTMQQFKTLRFRLTNGGNNLIVSTLDSQNDYIDLANIDVNLQPALIDQCKVSFIYASPLVNNDVAPARFDVQRYHVQGADVAPTSVALVEPLQVLSLPFINPVSLSFVPVGSASVIDNNDLARSNIRNLSLTAIAASAAYIAPTFALSAFVTNSNTDTTQVITYDNTLIAAAN